VTAMAAIGGLLFAGASTAAAASRCGGSDGREALAAGVVADGTGLRGRLVCRVCRVCRGGACVSAATVGAVGWTWATGAKAGSGEPEVLGDADGGRDGLRLGLGDRLDGLGDRLDGLGDRLDGLGDGLGVGLAVGVADGAGVAVAIGVVEGVGGAVAVGVTVGAADGDGSADDGAAEGEPVEDGAGEDEPVEDGAGEDADDEDADDEVGAGAASAGTMIATVEIVAAGPGMTPAIAPPARARSTGAAAPAPGEQASAATAQAVTAPRIVRALRLAART
jgi:hypothetical protein